MPGRRVSRRAFLTGAAAGTAAIAVGAGAYALRSGSGDSADSEERTPQPTATHPPPTATRAPSGVARIPAPARLLFDTLDPLRAVEPAVEQILGRSHSRLIEWADTARGLIGGDLATSWEQPEPGVWLVRLTPAAAWDQRAPTSGRRVMAEDVAAHFGRLMDERDDGALSPQLRLEFELLDSATALADDLVELRTSQPDPFFLAALAGRFAFVTAQEAVAEFEEQWHALDASALRGSGPFTVESIDGDLSFAAKGGHRTPLLERLEVVAPPGNGAPAVERFSSGELDEFLARDRRDMEALEAGFDSSARYEPAGTVSTVFAGDAPWNSRELRLAFSAALNRDQLAGALHGGNASPLGVVSPASAAFCVPEDELRTFAGYREDPAEDLADARALWSAAGGDALGPLGIDIPSIYDPLYGASALLPGLLREVLPGLEVAPAILAYPDISARALERGYGSGAFATWFGWAPPVDDPDPSRWLINTFRSGRPGWEPLGLQSDELDRLLDKLAGAFDAEARQALVRDVIRAILEEGGAGMFGWINQFGRVFRQAGYLAADPVPFASAHLDWLTEAGRRES